MVLTLSRLHILLESGDMFSADAAPDVSEVNWTRRWDSADLAGNTWGFCLLKRWETTLFGLGVFLTSNYLHFNVIAFRSKIYWSGPISAAYHQVVIKQLRQNLKELLISNKKELLLEYIVQHLQLRKAKYWHLYVSGPFSGSTDPLPCSIQSYFRTWFLFHSLVKSDKSSR